MESDAIINMVEDSFFRQRFIINAIVSKNYRTMQVPHS